MTNNAIRSSLTEPRTTRVLERITFNRSLPEVINIDYGPELVSKTMNLWKKNVFGSLRNARIKVEMWCEEYTIHRPHQSFSNMTPSELAENISDEITHLSTADFLFAN